MVRPWLLVLLVACGPSPGDLDFVRDERCEPLCDAAAMDAPDAFDADLDAGPVIPDEPLEDWDVDGAGPLTGIYAMRIAVNVKVVVDLVAIQDYRLRLVQRGRNIRMKAEPCSVGLPNIPNVAELVLPEALDALLKTKVTEEEGEFLSAEDPVGAMFAPPRVLVLLGADLENPFEDPLPTLDMLDNAFDEDGDGNPGVSIEASTVLCPEPEQAYVTVRLIADTGGTIESLDRFGGTVEASIEPTFLGFSDDCLEAAASLVIEPQPGSSFEAIRMGDAQDLDDNGNVSCPEITWLAPTIFTPED